MESSSKVELERALTQYERHLTGLSALVATTTRFPIHQVDVSTVSMKTNRDTPLDGASNPVDISSLPIPDVVKGVEREKYNRRCL